jgi:hypothetical protein
MRHRRLASLLTALVLGTSAAACATAESDADVASSTCASLNGKADGETVAYMMPADVVKFEREHGWGKMHLKFHTERMWDRLTRSGQEWNQRMGFSRATLQEGEPTTGLEFLAMHRHMITMLREQFPDHADLFAGWERPPTDPRDPTTPIPGTRPIKVSPAMLEALDRIQDDAQLAQFADDDEFGLWLQTRLRPTADEPFAATEDPTAGLHNYLHGRFQDAKSPVNVGNPAVNLENEVFWRIHGWVDARWTAYRAAKGLTNDDPAYQEALGAAAIWHHANTTEGKADGPDACVEVPDEVLATVFQ